MVGLCHGGNMPASRDDGVDDEGEDDVDQDCVVFPLISRSPPGTWQTRG